MRVPFLIASAVIACGGRTELGHPADGGVAHVDSGGGPACDVNAPFGPAIALGFTSAFGVEATLTSDELSAFAERRFVDSPYSKLVMLRRDSREAPFVEQGPVPGIDMAIPSNPSVAGDGLTLLLYCGFAIDEQPALCGYRRAELSAPFAPAPVSMDLPSHAWDPLEGFYANPSLTVLYYPTYTERLVRATRTDIGQPFGSVTKVSIDLPASDGGALVPDGAVVTGDELTIFFGVDEAPPAPGIWEARRTSAGETFTDAHPVSELVTPLGEHATWVSPDGCRLYFSRGLSTSELFMASRP